MKLPKMHTQCKTITITILITLDLVILLTLLFQSGSYVCGEVKQQLTRLVRIEQESHKDKLRQYLADTAGEVDYLQQEMEDLKKKRRIYIHEKKDLQSKLEKLEQESVRISLELSAYQNDVSIQNNPWRERCIDEAFQNAWALPLAINRLARSYEYVIFRGYLTEEQDELISKDMSTINWHLERLKL